MVAYNEARARRRDGGGVMLNRWRKKFGRSSPPTERAGSDGGCTAAPPDQLEDKAAKECAAAYALIEQSPDPAMAAITLAVVSVDVIAAVGGRRVARDSVMLQLNRIRAGAIPRQVEVEGLTVADVVAAIKAQAERGQATATNGDQDAGLRVFATGRPSGAGGIH